MHLLFIILGMLLFIKLLASLYVYEARIMLIVFTTMYFTQLAMKQQTIIIIRFEGFCYV